MDDFSKIVIGKTTLIYIMVKVFEINGVKDGQIVQNASVVANKDTSGEYTIEYHTQTHGVETIQTETSSTAQKIVAKSITVLSGDGFRIDGLEVTNNELGDPVSEVVEDAIGNHRHSFDQDIRVYNKNSRIR